MADFVYLPRKETWHVTWTNFLERNDNENEN